MSRWSVHLKPFFHFPWCLDDCNTRRQLALTGIISDSNSCSPQMIWYFVISILYLVISISYSAFCILIWFWPQHEMTASTGIISSPRWYTFTSNVLVFCNLYFIFLYFVSSIWYFVFSVLYFVFWFNFDRNHEMTPLKGIISSTCYALIYLRWFSILYLVSSILYFVFFILYLYFDSILTATRDDSFNWNHFHYLLCSHPPQVILYFVICIIYFVLCIRI